MAGWDQICPPSEPVGLRGIGDGCTTINTEYGFPNIGPFQATFTPACQRHDRCYTTLGATYAACDGQFLTDMRATRALRLPDP